MTDDRSALSWEAGKFSKRSNRSIDYRVLVFR